MNTTSYFFIDIEFTRHNIMVPPRWGKVISINSNGIRLKYDDEINPLFFTLDKMDNLILLKTSTFHKVKKEIIQYYYPEPNSKPKSFPRFLRVHLMQR